jgi:ABC-2 type transport system permease protein
VTQIFLWYAVFQARGDQPLAGYEYHQFVAYYLLTMVGRAFSSMPGLSSGIARQIRQGEIKKFLIQPVNMIGFLLLSRVAHKLAYYSVAIGPFALVFFLCREYFHDLPPEAATHSLAAALAFVASLLMAFLLGFFLESALGLVGFWWLEISSLLFVYMLFSFFLSGHMFPLDMLPEPWHVLVELLPLQYLAYFPAAVFLGKFSGAELSWHLLVEVAWIGLFIALNVVLYRRGLKRYSGFGG